MIFVHHFKQSGERQKTAALHTLFAGRDKSHNRGVDVSGCRIPRSHVVDFRQDVFGTHDGPGWSLKGRILKPRIKDTHIVFEQMKSW